MIDADAIRSLDLEKDRYLFDNRKFPTVLTPHVGEFASLFKVDKEKILENNIAN